MKQLLLTFWFIFPLLANCQTDSVCWETEEKIPSQIPSGTDFLIKREGGAFHLFIRKSWEELNPAIPPSSLQTVCKRKLKMICPPLLDIRGDICYSYHRCYSKNALGKGNIVIFDRNNFSGQVQTVNSYGIGQKVFYQNGWLFDPGKTLFSELVQQLGLNTDDFSPSCRDASAYLLMEHNSLNIAFHLIPVDWETRNRTEIVPEELVVKQVFIF